LWIAQDGTVERCELTEPFAALLGGSGLTAAWQVSQGSNKDQDGLDVGQAELGGENESPTSVEGRGLTKVCLVGLTLQHKNRDVLVEGPEIEIVRVRTRHLTAGGSR
jgi:hypothetical protein